MCAELEGAAAPFQSPVCRDAGGQSRAGAAQQGTEAVRAETSLLALSAWVAQTRGQDGVGTPRADVGHWQPAGHPTEGESREQAESGRSPHRGVSSGKGHVGVGAGRAAHRASREQWLAPPRACRGRAHRARLRRPGGGQQATTRG